MYNSFEKVLRARSSRKQSLTFNQHMPNLNLYPLPHLTPVVTLKIIVFPRLSSPAATSPHVSRPHTPAMSPFLLHYHHTTGTEVTHICVCVSMRESVCAHCNVINQLRVLIT